MKPRHRRLIMIGGGLAAVAAIAALVLNAFQSNLVFFYLVPEAGIEPARPFYERQILNLLCLPISPLGQTQSAIVIKTVSLVMRCNN